MDGALSREGNSMAQSILEVVGNVVGESSRPASLHEPEFRGAESKYVVDCLETGWVSSVGQYVDRFERDIAAFTGAHRAIAVANGTAALHICLQLAGVAQGDEVLTPALTFVATPNAVKYTGAVPHFVDCEPDTLGIDPGALERHLQTIAKIENGVCINKNTGARIRALVPMHVFGHPSKLDELSALCDRWCLVMVEDAAESLGSYYHGVHTGGRGLLSAISFNGNKIITTGGGGVILTNDEELGARAKHITTTARTASGWLFAHDEVGYNYRMPNLNAAVGCGQLERLPDFIARKRQLADIYIRAFQGFEGAEILAEPANCSSNYWLIAMRLRDSDMQTRDAVLETLNGKGIMARPVWTLMHRLPMYQDAPRAPLPVAEDMERRVINLPSSPKLVGT